MRLALLACLAVALSGCIIEPGLDESPTACPASQPLEDGIRLRVAEPGRLVGRCVAIEHDDVDRVLALRKLGADGVAVLPVEGAGRYYVHVSVNDENDRYCAMRVGEFVEHPGTGLVETQGEIGHVCA